MITKYIQETYDKNGYARIPGVFSKHETDCMRAGAYMALGHPNKALQTIKNKVEFPALLLNASSCSPYIKAIGFDPRMRKIITHFLGDYVYQLNDQIYYRLPGDGDEFAFHQDITFRVPIEAFDNVEDNYLQTVIAIDPITIENGAVEFIPGSHKMGDMKLVPRGTENGLRKFERKGWKGEKLTAQPGDVLIWSVMTIHGSEQNNSNYPRMYYMQGFAKGSSVLDKTRFPRYM